jgi:bifunctional non-homologous end joining protein LigD
MPLGRKPRPFDHPEYIFELEYDGFRALAVIEYGNCTLFSRNGNPFASFADLAFRIGNALMPRSAVLDSEIVCLDRSGRCSFNDLLFRRAEPFFVAFDLLYFNGKDLHTNDYSTESRHCEASSEAQRFSQSFTRITCVGLALRSSKTRVRWI